MKRNRYLMVVFVLFASLPMQVFAQDTSLVIGLKSWFANETLEIKDKNSGESVEEESEYTALVGPSLNIRYGSWFGGANYLTGELTFKDFIVTGVDVEIERTEWDVFGGYYFLPQLAVLLGYKQLEADAYNERVENIVTNNYSGVVLGLTGFYPVGRQSALYGTYTFAALEDENNTEYTGSTLEFGFASSLQNIALSYSIGLKIQVYQYDWQFEDPSGGSFDTERTDSFGGLTLGVNYKI